MSIEDRLREDLARAAGQAPRPDVAVAGLERLGRRERTRRLTTRVLAGTVAAVVAVAVAGLVSVPRLTGAAPDPAAPSPTPSTAPVQPDSLDDLTVGRPSEVAWWASGTLHVGGREVPSPYGNLREGPGTTVVGVSSLETGGARWFLLSGDRLLPLVSSGNLLDPVVSADGRAIAWAEATGATSRRLVAYDVASRSIRGVEDITVHPECCDAGGEAVVLGIDTDGRVVYDVPGRGTHVWTPGGADLVVRGVGGPVSPTPWPGGLTWQGGSRLPDGPRGVLATVDSSGRAHRVGTVPADQLGSWNADGSAYAYPGQADGGSTKAPPTDVWVDHLEGAPTRLLLPADRTFDIVGWESRTSIVLQTGNPWDEPPPAGERRGLVALVRCDASTGACERTADDVSPRAVVPYRD